MAAICHLCSTRTAQRRSAQRNRLGYGPVSLTGRAESVESFSVIENDLPCLAARVSVFPIENEPVECYQHSAGFLFCGRSPQPDFQRGGNIGGPRALKAMLARAQVKTTRRAYCAARDSFTGGSILRTP